MNRRIKRTTGHQVLIGNTVAPVHRVPAAQDSESAEFPGHPRNDLGELNTWNTRINHAIFALDVNRSLWLGIKRVMVTGPTLGPDQDAIHIR